MASNFVSVSDTKFIAMDTVASVEIVSSKKTGRLASHHREWVDVEITTKRGEKYMRQDLTLQELNDILSA
jgi:hypothetical protein